MPRLRCLILCLMAVAALPIAARADEVTDKIDQALSAYRNHDLAGAIGALDSAATLLRQARADAFKALLPPPPPGWTADPVETNAVAAMVLGGGITADRTYHNGDQQVQVQIVSDSPLMQAMASMLNTPLAAVAGAKTVVVAGRSVTYVSGDNSYMTLVAGKVLVKVNGSQGTPEPSVRSLVALIDFAAIEKLAK
jgi:ammonia channel protein AmtB